MSHKHHNNNPFKNSENLDEEIVKIIDKQDKKNKQLIYKLLNAAFMTIS